LKVSASNLDSTN